MWPRLLRFLIVSVALAQLLPSVVLAQASRAGVVTTLEGTVTVSTASLPQPRPLKFKDDVFVNDRIVTGDRSIARMLLGGKAVVTVRERSSLTITELPGKSTIALDSGKVALAVAREKVRPGEEIEVRTPNAVAGVRGTVFIAEVSQPTASLDASQSAVTSSFYGFAGVVTIRMGSQVVTLNPGTYVSATGLAAAVSGVMTDAMRAVALAGLQTGLKPAGGATQELANEQAMGTTVATFMASGAAVEAGPQQPPSAPAAGPSMTAPLLPGGIAAIPTPASTPPAAMSGKSGSSAFLVFGDRSAERSALAAQIASDFPSRVVVDVTGLPSDLSAFGTVWHVGAMVPFSAAEQTALRGFVGGGGGLHLTGERPCSACETVNASLTTFLRSVVEGGSGLSIGGQGDIDGPYIFSLGDRGGIAQRLLAGGVTQWQPAAPGGVAGVSGANVLVATESGAVVGALWNESDLLGDAGRITLLMDVNWFLDEAAPPVIQSINAFIDDAPNTLRLSGPLFQSVGDDLGAAGDSLLDIAGYTVIGSSPDPLVALSGSRVALPGSLMRLSESSVTSGGTLVRVDGASEIAQTGGEPMVWVSGGHVAVGGNVLDVAGRPEATLFDSSTGLMLGADRPIRPGAGAPLVQADNGSSVTVAGNGFRIDTAVLEATAPLLAVNGSTLATGADAIALGRQARVEIPNDAVALVSLRGGLLSVANGSLVNVAGASRLGVAGSLVSLAGGSTLNILNGALLSVSGGSVVSIGGPLVSFSGAGNVLNVTNSFVPTALISGIPVHGPVSSFSIGATPLAGLGTAGTININGVALTPTTPLTSLRGSLVTVQGSGTVSIAR
jgi:hypothetical protein